MLPCLSKTKIKQLNSIFKTKGYDYDISNLILVDLLYCNIDMFLLLHKAIEILNNESRKLESYIVQFEYVNVKNCLLCFEPFEEYAEEVERYKLCYSTKNLQKSVKHPLIGKQNNLADIILFAQDTLALTFGFLSSDYSKIFNNLHQRFISSREGKEEEGVYYPFLYDYGIRKY